MANSQDNFNQFIAADDFPQIISCFHDLIQNTGQRADDGLSIYKAIKTKFNDSVSSQLWKILDKRMSMKEYGNGEICRGTNVSSKIF